jgi:membrane protease YdiL (CAAX protease family)
MPAARSSRDTIVGALIAVPTLIWMALVATDGAGRWPWVGFVVLAAVPILFLPLPSVQERVRAMVAGSSTRALAVVAAIAGYGAVLTFASGVGPWYDVLLWPVCLGVAYLAAVTETAEMSAGRILLCALAIAFLAGRWNTKLQTNAPGYIDLDLQFFGAVDVALFLLLVVRPLRTFDVGLGLRPRDLGAALVALAALMVVALPAGYVIGFLQFNSRWVGLGYGVSRLFGLIFFVGLPEELLFRGMIQEAFTRFCGPRVGWIAGSVLFGLTHIVKHAPPLNWRYALLATVAGLAYGWVYRRTGKLAAAALTHGLVDWIWSTFLLVP